MKGELSYYEILVPSHERATMKIQLITRVVGTLLAATWVGTASAAPLAPSLPESAMFAALAPGIVPQQIEPDSEGPSASARRQLPYRSRGPRGPIADAAAQIWARKNDSGPFWYDRS